MKSIILLVTLLLATTLFLNCTKEPEGQLSINNNNNNNTAGLTKERAQRALDRWIVKGKDGKLTVQGIQELPQQNMAKVDCVVERIEWNEQYIGRKQYQGPAIAIFTHYTDGRWVLTQISLTNDWLAKFNTNIVAD